MYSSQILSVGVHTEPMPVCIVVKYLVWVSTQNRQPNVWQACLSLKEILSVGVHTEPHTEPTQNHEYLLDQLNPCCVD